MYYSGHGNPGFIRFSDFEMRYEDIVKHILDSANSHINKIGEPKERYSDRCESFWYFTWYIDACHSGSAVDVTSKWLEE